MLNVAAVQAEIEQHQQQLMREAADYRRARAAGSARVASGSRWTPGHPLRAATTRGLLGLLVARGQRS